MKQIPITTWCQMTIKNLVCSPALCIDATAGTGRDTQFLCEISKEDGRVLAMDIQEQALALTKERLKKENLFQKVTLIHDSHENMDRYAMEESVDLIMFNLGYLPGGDHQLATKADTTIPAVEKGLTLLKHGGVMSLMIYSGGDSGFDEKNAVLPFLESLDPGQYTVIMQEFINKPNHPPIPVMILKA